MKESRPGAYVPPELRLAPGGLPVQCTAAAFLVRAGELLLEKRPEGARPAAGLWDTPGGHLEEGERPEAALVRELREELGISALRFRLAGVQDEHDRSTGRFYRHYLYILTAWSGQVRPREGQTLGWFSLGDVVDLEGLNPLIGFALSDFLDHGWLGATP